MTESDDEMYKAMQESAGIVDMNDRTLIEVAGADRAKHLHNFCTADVNALNPGQGSEAFILNAKGRTIGFINLICNEDRLLIDASPGQFDVLHSHLDRYVIREDVVMTDRADAVGRLLLRGPNAGALLLAAGAESLPGDPLRHVTARLHEVPTQIVKTDWTGNDEFLLLVEMVALPELSTALVSVGATCCDQATFDVMRIEAGTPRYGADVTDANLPQEVGRTEQAISFRKGCYLGQETVARIDALGHVNKHFVSLTFAADASIEPGMELYSETKSVGSITSVCRSPKHAGTLALGYVKTAIAKSGSVVIAGDHSGIVIGKGCNS